MPLYEFRCDACGEFEAWRTLAELDKPIDCPTCEATAKRIFSPPNINLNSGNLFLIGNNSGKKPKLVKRDREPGKPRYQSTTGGRPWMVSHAPSRY